MWRAFRFFALFLNLYCAIFTHADPILRIMNLVAAVFLLTTM